MADRLPPVLARCDGPDGPARALEAAWPTPPAGGTVALVALPVEPQGTAGPAALPVEVVLAAARRLGAAGARVRVVCAPGRLDAREPLEARLDALAAEGVDVVRGDAPAPPDGAPAAGRRREVGGRRLARAALLEAVAAADRVAVVAAAVPHRHLRVAGPLLALADALDPAAREQLWRAASDPEVLREALGELAAALGPVLAAAWLGPELGALVGGDDVLAVDAVAARCLGLEGPALPTRGLDPSLVAREHASARRGLPEGPERFPGVDLSLCTRCEVCVDLCPTGAIALPGGRHGADPLAFDHGACLRCGVCVAACPDFALTASVRPGAARRPAVEGLDLPEGEAPAVGSGAVPARAAMALGPDAVDPPPRRPAWLEGYQPVDRFERARRRERHPEPLVPRTRLPADGAVRLVIPPNWGIKGNRTSLGIAYLAGTLDAAGHACHVVDLAHEIRAHDPSLNEALEVFGNPDPNGGLYGPRVPLLLQVVDPAAWGEACPTLARRVHESAERDAERLGDPGALHGLIVADSSVTYAFALGAALRRRGARVVLGGPTMSHAPTAELALRAGVADAAVMGEGEAAIIALAEAHRDGAWAGLADARVPGLLLWDGGRLRTTPNFRNRELDALPFPDWRGQSMPPDHVPILAARGCVTRCSFCSEQTISPKFAQRSVEDVLTEMELMAERFGVRRFEFNDDLLNGNRHWLQAFCEALVARGAPYEWQGLCRPHKLPRELLQLMRDAGCVQISYGVQHFSWRMLRVMGRREEPDPLRQVLDDTLEVGLECYIDIILGHPGETEEDVDITVDAVRDLMARYPGVAINLNPFNYIYGSAVDLRPEDYGVSVTRFSGELPAPFAGLADVAARFATGFSQDPGPEVVVDRVNRLARTVFEARMPEKIPILDEELPYCNDNCLHCGVADIMRTANVVPLDRVVRSLRELAPRSGGRVMFAVSELTIRPDFLKIVRAARQAGMGTVALVTNGRMFVYPEFTRRAVAAGLTHALVSVYGPTARVHQAITRTPRSFEQTLGGLENLLRYPEVTVMTNSVITRKSYRYLPQMVELLGGLGVRNVNLSFVQIIGNAATYERALVPRIRDVLPALREAVDLGVSMGLNMGIGGLPYCVLKGYESHFGVDDLTTIANGDPGDTITSRSPYARADACRRCAYNAVCLGMQEEYLARYGEEELDPYHGRRLERRPDSEIVRAMFPDLQFTAGGQPSSLFGRVAPAGGEGVAAPGAPPSGGR